MSGLIKLLATGLGTGYLPYVAGSAGTLVAIPIFLALSHLGWPLYFFITLLFTVASVWISNRALPLLQDLKKPGDPSQIVIDEVVGFLWTLGIVRYAGFWNPQEGLIGLLLISYIFFRLFDIAKWWPVSWAEKKWSGGMGIVMDDVVAGILAGLASILFCIVYPLVIYAFKSLV